MPISSEDLAKLSRTSLDDYLKNTPVDQVTQDQPFINRLLQGKKPFGGAKQYIKENIRKSHDSNFKWMYGEEKITFKKRDTVLQTEFPWRHAIDSIYRSDDELYSNGIRVVRGDGGKVKLQSNEKVQLINQIDEDNSNLRTGFFENLNLHCLRDGTSSADAIVGLDGLVTLTPEQGKLGNIDRATAKYWRNTAMTGLTKDTMVDAMEQAWRQCMRYAGGQSPDFILAGSDFIDAYRKCLVLTQNVDAGKVKRLDASTGEGNRTGLYWKGKEIIWDPTFDVLDDLDTPETKWAKRCYFLNMRNIQWHEDGYDIFSPDSPHDTLCLYTVVSMRCALTMNRANAHAVLALA